MVRSAGSLQAAKGEHDTFIVRSSLDSTTFVDEFISG